MSKLGVIFIENW